MIAFLICAAVNALALLAIAELFKPAIEVRGYGAAFIAALILGLTNAIVKPLLNAIAQVMTCALTCLTLGLWSLVLSWLINAALFWAVGNALEGFEVRGFWPAMWGSLALSIVNAIATVLTSPEEKDERE